MPTNPLVPVIERVKAGAAFLVEESPMMMAAIARIDDAAVLKECRAQITAVQAYIAQRTDLSVQEHNAAVMIKARVEHRLGEVLRETVRPRGRNSSDNSMLPEEIKPMQSSRAQQLAALPWTEIQARIDARTEANQKASVAAVVREIRKEQTNDAPPMEGACEINDLHRAVALGITFGTIYADPPWQYDNQATRAATDNHYKTMTIGELCELPVGRLAAPQAHLWLWTTNGFLFECPKLFGAWGFEFKSSYVWVKPQWGIGNYLRNSHELLLLAVKGGLTGAATDVRSWGEFSRGEHSAKPNEIRREVIERVSPNPRIELFARKPVDGWVVWGNGVTKTMFDTDMKQLDSKGG